MRPTVTISNEPTDLWELTEPITDFRDEYDVLNVPCLSSLCFAFGYNFEGSIMGYLEATENKKYTFDYASGRYNLSAYTPSGELIDTLDFCGDNFVKWVGVRKIPFVGYIKQDKKTTGSPEGTIWAIVPKSKEQFLSAIATFYKRRRKKDEAPNIVGLQEYLDKPTSVGDVTDLSTFVPLRIRERQDKPRATATKKRIEEYRATATEVTNAILVEAIQAKYKGFFIDYETVAIEAIKEAYRNELPLTLENVLQELDYLVEDRKLLKYYTVLQNIYSKEAQELRAKVDEATEQIYNLACKRVFDLSELVDRDVLEYFQKEAYKNRTDLTLAKKLYNVCCNYHCRKYDLVSCVETGNFPPFKCFDYRNGKDVTFAPSFEEAKTYHEKMKEDIYATPTESKQSEPKKGCLLWFILVPTTLLALLYSIL